jgi:anti-sigma regulatory factor (Ser/Thr protein kinase)
MRMQNTPRTAQQGRAGHGFRHEAMLYAGDQGFLAATLPFVRAAVAQREPILVVVGAAKIARLRAELGDDAAHVLFEDMAGIGTNPARIIPAWRAFVDGHAARGRRVRGIGEPVWAGRTAAELVECQRHECLLNLAFADAADFWLACPYDVAALDPGVIERVDDSHPILVQDGTARASGTCLDDAALCAPFADPLPEPAAAREVAFDDDALFGLRALVATHATGAGLDELRTGDLVLAVHELATNSVRHGGGHGVLRMWHDDDAVICEVRDAGHIVQPMAGRERPPSDQLGGHGLWLINQLCDLVQIRSFASGGVVRLHVRRGAAAAA